MARRLGLAAAAVATAVALIAVGVLADRWLLLPYTYPGSKHLPLTVVARNGPYAGATIMISSSIADLTTLVIAVSGSPDRCPGGTCWPGATIPRSSLLIALPNPDPCRESTFNADLSSSNVLELHIVIGSSLCGLGGNMAPSPNFWLLAVPRNELPSNALSVVIDERGDNNFLPMQTMVDLRPPDETTGGVISVADVRSTMDAATLDSRARGNPVDAILKVGFFRWLPGAATCANPADGLTDEAWGSFVVLASYETAWEYRGLGGATVFCGSRSIPDSYPYAP